MRVRIWTYLPSLVPETACSPVVWFPTWAVERSFLVSSAKQRVVALTPVVPLPAVHPSARHPCPMLLFAIRLRELSVRPSLSLPFVPARLQAQAQADPVPPPPYPLR